MCTVTLIPLDSGIRMACNRDEARTRPPALPPRVVAFGGRRALMPVDPVSDGTWVAVNDAGLVCTILNAHALARKTPFPPPRFSRGTIIPQLLSAGTLQEAYERSLHLAPADYAPLRLLLADRRCYAQLYATDATLEKTPPTPITGPLLFTSSGLGDALVDAPRRELFHEFFTAGRNWREQQDAYQRHFWPDRRAVSVCMQRPEARTVSLTVVEVEAELVRMSYYPEAPDQAPQPIVMALPTRTI
jgi:hypothetical protein